MPAKKSILSDVERAKRIRETAEKYDANDDPKVLYRAFKHAADTGSIRKSPKTP
jgi:hypothetical protein